MVLYFLPCTPQPCLKTFLVDVCKTFSSGKYRDLSLTEAAIEEMSFWSSNLYSQVAFFLLCLSLPPLECLNSHWHTNNSEALWMMSVGKHNKTINGYSIVKLVCYTIAVFSGRMKYDAGPWEAEGKLLSWNKKQINIQSRESIDLFIIATKATI